MEKIVERSLLFDIYGPLLTDHQKSIYSDVVNNDYSLSEIGEELGISRQGVHDAVKRIDKILTDYEDKLHFADSYEKNQKIIDDIKVELKRLSADGVDCSKISSLVDKLSEDL
ncbi:MAG: YlxM family DNA-binding protein [Lachnospiraceae bacterium]|nr:YlxM family DNA-binding protein [Lachnospiraceae bacterium]